jgi:thiamine transport system substrate-binding protein
MRRSIVLVLLALMMSVAACQPVMETVGGEDDSGSSAGGSPTLVLASHDSFSVSEEVIAQFEAESGATVQFLSLGDAGEALNKLILSKDAPLADLFFGVDNTFLSRALDDDVFVAYDSPRLSDLPDDVKLDAQSRLIPVDVGYVNINADKGWYDEQGLPLPQTLEDLALPRYAGQLVVQNPAASSPGLAFLLTTINHFGEDGYLDFWSALRENDVLITDGWSEAYFESLHCRLRWGRGSPTGRELLDESAG